MREGGMEEAREWGKGGREQLNNNVTYLLYLL